MACEARILLSAENTFTITVLEMRESKIQELERKYCSQVFGRFPVAIAKGKGPYVWDTEGRKYLDFYAGIAVVALGHCHPKVVAALKKQADTLWHASNWYYTQPQVELAQLLSKISGMERVFFTNDGSESTECAIKLARKVTGRKEIIAFKNSFHGRTMGALSLTWTEKYRKPFEPLLPGAKFVEYNNANTLEAALTKDTAAVIVEPIQGEAGVIIPDDGYLKALREATEKNGSLLIVDECQTGFGRTGTMFAFQKEKIQPDILCLAKALGNGFPIGATLFSGFDFEKGQHGGTYVGGPLACAAAIACIDIFEKDGLLKLTPEKIEVLETWLKEVLSLHHVGDVRNAGLMAGVELVRNKKTKEPYDWAEKIGWRVAYHARENGVFIRPLGNIIVIMPPLSISKQNLNQLLKVIKESIVTATEG